MNPHFKIKTFHILEFFNWPSRQCSKSIGNLKSEIENPKYPNSIDSDTLILLFLTFSKILTPVNTITYKFHPKNFRIERTRFAHR